MLIETPIRIVDEGGVLWLGCDRDLLILLSMICALTVFMLPVWQIRVSGAVLWFVGLGVLRMMAKADPLSTDIYRDSLKYSKYYQAQATPFAETAYIQSVWKKKLFNVDWLPW